MKTNAAINKNKFLLRFDELCTATGGTILCNCARTDGVSAVAIDSRACSAGALFVPLRGEKQDGHTYIEAALQKGAVCFFADEDYAAQNKAAPEKLCKHYEAACIIVKNNLYALQDCARVYRQKFPKLLRIGITGSSGKTTTKEILAHILAQEKNIVFTQGNLNSETGLPLSVFTVHAEHEAAVFELGMNRKNEIAELARVFEPQIGIVTNIGTAHIGMLGSRHTIAEEKKKIFSLFDQNCAGFAPDDEWFCFLAEGVNGKMIPVNAKKIEAEKFLHLKNLGEDGFEFDYAGHHIRFHLIGEHNLANACMAVAVAEYLHIKPKSIAQGLEEVRALYGRAEIVKGSKANYLFDVYNANPQSMAASISFLSDVKNAKRKIAVLGSMLELGDYTNDAHKKIIAEVAESHIDFCFLYGDEFEQAARELNVDTKKFLVYKTAEAQELAKNFEAKIAEGDFVLLKGSRSLKLEQFAKCLGGAI